MVTNDVSFKIVNRIRELRLSHYSDEMIIKELVQQGCPLSYATQMVSYVNNQDSSHGALYQTLASSKLSSSSSSSINTLSASSQNSSDSFSSTYGSSFQNSSDSQVSRPHKSLFRFFVIVLVIFLIIVGVYFVLELSDSSRSSPISSDVSLHVVTAVLQSSSQSFSFFSVIDFSKSITSYPVQILYELVDSQGEVVSTWKVTHLLTSSSMSNTKSVINDTFIIARLSPLTQYELKTSIFSNANLVGSSSVFFPVNPKLDSSSASLPINTGNGSTTSNGLSGLSTGTSASNSSLLLQNSSVSTIYSSLNSSTTGANLANNSISSGSNSQVLNSGTMTVEDIMVNAKQLSVSNPIEAARQCLTITTTYNRDNCLYACATESKNYAFCDEIISSKSRDSCYISYVIASQDYPACNAIINANIKLSCQRLNPAFSSSSNPLATNPSSKEGISSGDVA